MPIRLTNPLVMWLVDVLVQSWVMLQPVHPVNASVCKDEEEGHGEEGVGKTLVGNVVVQHRMASNFRQEPRQGQESKRRESLERVLNFKLDLVRQKARVVLHVVVEEKVVRVSPTIAERQRRQLVELLICSLGTYRPSKFDAGEDTVFVLTNLLAHFSSGQRVRSQKKWVCSREKTFSTA